MKITSILKNSASSVLMAGLIVGLVGFAQAQTSGSGQSGGSMSGQGASQGGSNMSGRGSTSGSMDSSSTCYSRHHNASFHKFLYYLIYEIEME